MSDERSAGEIAQASAATSLSPDARTIAAVLDIEKQRIDRDNRRTAVIEKRLEIADAEAKRQFTHATQTRDAELALRQDQLKFVRKVIWTLLALGSVVVLSLLGLLIFGDDAQSMTVAAIVKPLLIGLAGYGVVTALARVFKALIRR